MSGFVAARDYKPGDLIYKEDAFVRVLSREMKDTRCDYCFRKSNTLTTCNKCSSVRYCKNACQKAARPDHQLECKHLKNLPKSPIQDKVRLVGNVILKIKGKDWKKITTNILGTEMSFDDINPDYEKMKEDPLKMLQNKALKRLLKGYIGDENMPEEEDVVKIIEKVIHNSGRGRANESRLLSYCFFLGMNSFDEECIPNSNFEVVDDKTLKIWASKNIKKGSDKITVTRRSVLFQTPQIPSDCKCTECRLPYGESVFTKLVDESRAFTVISATQKFLQLIDCEPILPLIPDLWELTNETIRGQKDILADTHALHLRVLAVKCFKLRENPFETIADLTKLEKIMSSIFGPYYLEMEPIYTGLAALNLQVGNIAQGSHYFEKIKALQLHR